MLLLCETLLFGAHAIDPILFSAGAITGLRDCICHL
jgi:hypothetical protein